MKIVILAGGKGARLWPVSRRTFPKQFLPIKEKTLFRQTVERCLLLESPRNIFISTNQNYSFYVERELKRTKISKKNIIIEPFSKNTGPAVLYALNKIQGKKNELIFICPSDHYIFPDKKFIKDVEKAQKIASLNYIVTFGIKPLSPETGYGYIKAKNSFLKIENERYYQVEKFMEKPCLRKAKDFLRSKNYYWNSGIFLFPYNLIMEEFNRFVFNIGDLANIKPVSFDKAIVEKSNKVATIPATFCWSDVGSWESFYQAQKKDNQENVIIGNVLAHDLKNSLVLGNNRLVVCYGLKNMAVIETDDAVFVSPKKKSQEVKSLVEELERNNKKEAYEGLKKDHPWGSCIALGEGKGYKIKRVIINSKKILRLQSHKLRSEHWVVVKGKAKITINNKKIILKKGESAFVPKQAKHRLENPSGKDVLEIIEVQNGSYLGEDDIVRYEECLE